MDEVEFHAPPRESKSKRWLSFHPFSGCQLRKLRKSRRIVLFLMLPSSKMGEVSHNFCVFDVVKFKN